jgi:putative oxidoreductase
MFLVRLGFGGFLFLNHGLIKLNRFSELKNSFSDPFHVGHTTSLMLALFAEVFCSILLVIGLLTRLASFVLVILFLTIIFIIQKHKPLQDSELAILYLMASITTLFCGPGKWSLDRLIGK